jgi:hypothetical protein
VAIFVLLVRRHPKVGGGELGGPKLVKGSILQNFISAESALKKSSSLKFRKIPNHKNQQT